MILSIKELKQRIKICNKYKKQVYNNIDQIENPDSWLKYYNDYIDYCNSEIKKKKVITVMPFVLIGLLFVFYIGFESEITTIIGLVPYEGNETEDNITIENFTEYII